jgi:hypothetical protein
MAALLTMRARAGDRGLALLTGGSPLSEFTEAS